MWTINANVSKENVWSSIVIIGKPRSGGGGGASYIKHAVRSLSLGCLRLRDNLR